MEQDKLFYNICHDLWTFAKTLKQKSEMTDKDWSNAIENMDKITEKYKTLGQREYELVNKLLLEMLNYIERS